MITFDLCLIYFSSLSRPRGVAQVGRPVHPVAALAIRGLRQRLSLGHEPRQGAALRMLRRVQQRRGLRGVSPRGVGFGFKQRLEGRLSEDTGAELRASSKICKKEKAYKEFISSL